MFDAIGFDAAVVRFDAWFDLALRISLLFLNTVLQLEHCMLARELCWPIHPALVPVGLTYRIVYHPFHRY